MSNLFVLRESLSFLGYDRTGIDFIVARTSEQERNEFIADAICAGFDIQKCLETKITERGVLLDKQTVTAVMRLINDNGVNLYDDGN